MATTPIDYEKLRTLKPWNPQAPLARVYYDKTRFRKYKVPDGAAHGDKVVFDDEPNDGYALDCGCRDPDFDVPDFSVDDAMDGDKSPLLTMGMGLLGATLGAGLALGLHRLGQDGAAATGTTGGVGALGAGLAMFDAAAVGTSLATDSDKAALGAGAVAGAFGALGGAGAPPLLAAGLGAMGGFVGGVLGWLYLKHKAASILFRVTPSWVHVENRRDRTLKGWTKADENKRDPNGVKAAADEIEREVQGHLIESFQTYMDTPPWQIHQYFDWNFHLVPDPGFRYIVSKGSLVEYGSLRMECEWDSSAFSAPPGAPDDPPYKLGTKKDALTISDFKPGASPSIDAAYFRAGMFWPMPGVQVWLAGRWIYDCGHGEENPAFEAESDKLKKDFDLKEKALKLQERTLAEQKAEYAYATKLRWEDEHGLAARDADLKSARKAFEKQKADAKANKDAVKNKDFNVYRKSKVFKAELHPVKAGAFTRWEGVKFERNRNKYVPGIRFVFFCSKYGGYYDFPAINQSDYEFVVDLPPSPVAEPARWELEPLPGYDGSRVPVIYAQQSNAIPPPGAAAPVVARRTELLVNVDVKPYATALRGKKADIKPVIVPWHSEGRDLTRPPDQVKITIPLSGAGDAGAYGVNIELGWLDNEEFALARAVNKYTVTFHELRRFGAHTGSELEPVPSFEGTTEEWRMRFGVNDRWTQTAETPLPEGGTLSLLDHTVAVYLADDTDLTLTMEGTEHDAVEELFRWKPADRVIKITKGGQESVVDFQADVVKASPRVRLRVARAILEMMKWTLSNTSDSISRVVARLPATSGLERKRAVLVATQKQRNEGGGAKTVVRRMDYELEYSIHVEPQQFPGPDKKGD